MKFSIRQDQLIQPLQMVSSIVDRRHESPLLANILLRITPQGLTLTGTDLEVEMITHINISNAQTGETTLPARKLLDICRTIPGESDISFSIDGSQATIRCGRSRFTLATLPSDEFPALKGIDDPEEFAISQQRLKQLIDYTSFSMANQDVRYFLNGICMELHKDSISTVATDGHRLALCSLRNETGVSETRQLIIPRKAVIELSRLLSENDEEVTIQTGTNSIRFLLTDVIFSTRLIDGQFPDYERVIPQSNSNELVVDRVSLGQALKRASILSNEKIRSVRLNLESELLRISARNQEQEESEEEVPARYSGGSLEIGFNVNYLLDILQVLDDEQVRILFGDSNSSCLINSSEPVMCRYVVMPMRL